MSYSEAQKRATLKYRREKTKNITVTFYQKEADIRVAAEAAQQAGLYQVAHTR